MKNETQNSQRTFLSYIWCVKMKFKSRSFFFNNFLSNLVIFWNHFNTLEAPSIVKLKTVYRREYEHFQLYCQIPLNQNFTLSLNIQHQDTSNLPEHRSPTILAFHLMQTGVIPYFNLVLPNQSPLKC